MTSSASPSLQLRPGTVVGEYRVVKPIGRGGMGIVYRATHPELDNAVAVKVLNEVWDRDAVSRFKQEARLISQLRHPHIVQAFSFGSLSDGRCYYVMDYLEGSSLKSVLSERKRLDVAETVSVLQAVASALSAVHDKGIVHRDIKPANVFLLAGGGVKLLDFGIAKLADPKRAAPGTPRATITQTGKQVGTPRYMSPEQARGVEVDHRSDIYGLGLLAFECLTGVAPFGEGPSGELLMHHQMTPAPPPSRLNPALTETLDRPILRALSKAPRQRHQTAADFAADLAQGANLGADAPSWPLLSSSSPQVSRTARPIVDHERSRTVYHRSPHTGHRIWMVGTTALVLCAAAAWLLLAKGRSREPRPVARSPMGASFADVGRVVAPIVDGGGPAPDTDRSSQPPTHKPSARTKRKLSTQTKRKRRRRTRRHQHPVPAGQDDEGSLIRF